MAILDIVVVLGIFIGLGFVILSKMLKNNPRAAEIVKPYLHGGLTEKTEPDITKSEQIYRDKGSML